MNSDLLAKHIEALLFALGKPLSRSELARALETNEGLEDALALLAEQHSSRGIVLVDDGTMVELRTSPEVAPILERIRRDEQNRDIGKAGLETLSAVLYRGPLTRSEIDFIRGVNSSQILRTLTMRGLLRRVTNPKDERSFLYEATTDLLGQLGVAHARELPEYTQVQQKLLTLEESYRNQETTI